MSKNDRLQAKKAIKNAQEALRSDNRRDAHRWAASAARLAPKLEMPWLILASVSSPKASLAYLKKALEINPASQRARQGVHWAIQRQRSVNKSAIIEPLASSLEVTTRLKTRRPQPVLGDTAPRRINQYRQRPHPTPVRIPILTVLPWIPWMATVMILCLALAFLASFSTDLIVLAKSSLSTQPAIAIVDPSLTPTTSSTPKSTLTQLPTNTSTNVPAETPTNPPIYTPTNTPTFTPTPLPTQTLQPIGAGLEYYISGPRKGRWIDIDLSNQRLYAYQNGEIVRSFLVSTGLWQYPTLPGRYSIYVKYRYDDMTGPGYYLPDVPYTMYYYRGYGIHGTYWHNNFGSPMSHGCVNMRTDDAGWLFNWASVGTMVYIYY